MTQTPPTLQERLNSTAMTIAIASVGLAFLIGIILGQHSYDWSLQTNFPCQEDEVLMFSNVDTTHTMCINIEQVPEVR